MVRFASQRYRRKVRVSALCTILACAASVHLVSSVASSEHIRREEKRREKLGGQDADDDEEYQDNPVPGTRRGKTILSPTLLGMMTGNAGSFSASECAGSKLWRRPSKTS